MEALNVKLESKYTTGNIHFIKKVTSLRKVLKYNVINHKIV
jgi:hypothetical protein